MSFRLTHLGPGFGTQGKRIAVYSNYFRVDVPNNFTIHRYNVECSPEAKGKKLARIFELLLEKPSFSGSVTDGKSIIISLNPLNIQDGYTESIVYLADGQDEPLANAVTYTIRIVSPTSLDVAALVNHLRATGPTPGYTQQLETVQALNILLGHTPQANEGVVSIGQNRHFSVDRSQGNLPNIKILGGGLESLRGYFQSLRTATGGLLLNVNVTHGVFLEPIQLNLLIPKMGTGNMLTLQKKLKLVRVRVIHLPAKKSKKNLDIPRVKTIFGVAHPQDGRNDAHPPQIQAFGAGPKGVMFWLGAAPTAKEEKPGKKASKADGGLPTNAYISVFDYFRRSKFLFRLKMHDLTQFRVSPDSAKREDPCNECR